MRICFLSPLVPSVAYGHRPHSFLTHLVGAGHEVELHCIDDPGPVPTAAAHLREKEIRVHLHPLAKFKRWANCGFGLLGKEPLRILHCRDHGLIQGFANEVAEGDYDVVHIDRFRLGPYAKAAQAAFKGPVILDFPDALSMYYERAVQNPRHWAKGWIDRREHRVIPDYERKVLEWDLENIVCSDVDRARLLSHRPQARIHVIPNMVDVEEFHPRRRADNAPRILFTGTLYYLPNIDGLLWLRREVMPLLKKSIPRVDVLGFGATSELDPVKADPRFHFEGYVENMAEHLFQGDLYLCPLRVGAGVRFKLLEAFAAGMATISTTLGYEGIPCTPGEHLLVADTAGEFAAAIDRLLADPAERQRIGNNAREFVLERYSVEAAGRALEAVYSQAAG